jgi:DNA-binding protein H-NS
MELKEQAEDLLRRAEAARKSEIGAAIAEIKAKMAAYAITLDDLDDLGGKSKAVRVRRAKGGKAPAKAAKPAKVQAKQAKARKPVAVKYRNLETNETWTGRGKAPRWMKVQEAGGRKREEFLVR